MRDVHDTWALSAYPAATQTKTDPSLISPTVPQSE
eukprot:CAMPEP_0173384568 /NCGR_PEP_ID=MMETSP1356-20130122/7143_1 /TAXON_ID=77927 ORGANISM="Hemiselmis virescens, Strain PCC157" /NCGR_SAMPLE_ID=MMETSP1356 /ASSEMBLY_ACC=CAM_ASM_000847 /LENGTH=34 /DNA_ID= /DNA_START= /DNA_END= /DNA_ORIENTATION=